MYFYCITRAQQQVVRKIIKRRINQIFEDIYLVKVRIEYIEECCPRAVDKPCKVERPCGHRVG